MINKFLAQPKKIAIGIAIVIFLFLIIHITHSVSLLPTPAPTPSPTSTDKPLPNPNVLKMDGSTSMVKLMKLLRNGYAQINPNIPTTYGIEKGDVTSGVKGGVTSRVKEDVTCGVKGDVTSRVKGNITSGVKYSPSGSNGGLTRLLNGEVQIAASSRVLEPKEAEAGVQLFAIAHDAIAIVVGVDNPFETGLTKEQLRKIYQGKIKNWSELGVSRDLRIRVYNRAGESGTQSFFKENVLLGGEFASDDPGYFETCRTDETTAVLSQLKSDGIYYATVSQANQTMVRVVPIDGVDPTDPQTILRKTYPIVRDLYLAIPQKPSPAAKQFVDFALSEDGQKLVKEADLVPVK